MEAKSRYQITRIKPKNEERIYKVNIRFTETQITNLKKYCTLYKVNMSLAIRNFINKCIDENFKQSKK